MSMTINGVHFGFKNNNDASIVTMTRPQEKPIDLIYIPESFQEKNQYLHIQFMVQLCYIPRPNVQDTFVTDASKTKIALEAEYVIENIDDANDHFIATKNANECIAVLLTDGKKRGLIHVSDIPVSLDGFLSHFKGCQHLKAILVGGKWENEYSRDISQRNLNRILKSFLEFSENIVIESHCLALRNKISDLGIYHFVRDNVVNYLTIIYEGVFNKDVPEGMFDKFKGEDFRMKPCSPAWNDYELYHVVTKMRDARTLMPLACPHVWDFRAGRKALPKSDESFKRVLEAVFSKNCFVIMCGLGLVPSRDDLSELTSFSFDNKNRIRKISYHLKTENEFLRNLFLLRIRTDNQYEYFCISDSVKDYLPDLDEAVRNGMRRLQPAILKGPLDESLTGEILKYCTSEMGYFQQVYIRSFLKVMNSAVKVLEASNQNRSASPKSQPNTPVLSPLLFTNDGEADNPIFPGRLALLKKK